MWITRSIVVLMGMFSYWALCVISPGFELGIAALVFGGMFMGLVLCQNAYLRGRRDGAGVVNAEIKKFVAENSNSHVWTSIDARWNKTVDLRKGGHKTDDVPAYSANGVRQWGV